MAKILVVDDESAIQLLIKAVLKKEHEVSIASDGEEALNKIQEEGYPDLMILDIMMPGGLDGIELCQKIREQKDSLEVPIIILSALETHHDIVDALNMGANDYLVKPFNNNELKARVNSLLNLKIQKEKYIKDEHKRLLNIYKSNGLEVLLRELSS